MPNQADRRPDKAQENDPAKDQAKAQAKPKFIPGRDFERRSTGGTLRGVEVSEENSAEAWEAFQTWQTLQNGENKAEAGESAAEFESTNPAPLPPNPG